MSFLNIVKGFYPGCVNLTTLHKLSVYIKQFRTNCSWNSVLVTIFFSGSITTSIIISPQLNICLLGSHSCIGNQQGMGECLVRVRKSHICSSAFAIGKSQDSQLHVICVTTDKPRTPLVLSLLFVQLKLTALDLFGFKRGCCKFSQCFYKEDDQWFEITGKKESLLSIEKIYSLMPGAVYYTYSNSFSFHLLNNYRASGAVLRALPTYVT